MKSPKWGMIGFIPYNRQPKILKADSVDVCEVSGDEKTDDSYEINFLNELKKASKNCHQ